MTPETKSRRGFLKSLAAVFGGFGALSLMAVPAQAGRSRWRGGYGDTAGGTAVTGGTARVLPGSGPRFYGGGYTNYYGGGYNSYYGGGTTVLRRPRIYGGGYNQPSPPPWSRSSRTTPAAITARS